MEVPAILTLSRRCLFSDSYEAHWCSKSSSFWDEFAALARWERRASAIRVQLSLSTSHRCLSSSNDWMMLSRCTTSQLMNSACRCNCTGSMKDWRSLVTYLLHICQSQGNWCTVYIHTISPSSFSRCNKSSTEKVFCGWQSMPSPISTIRLLMRAISSSDSGSGEPNRIENSCWRESSSENISEAGCCGGGLLLIS